MSHHDYVDATSEQYDKIRVKYVWQIDGFERKRCSPNGHNHEIKSKPFGSYMWPECVWQLHMYPKWSPGDVACYLHHVGAQTVAVKHTVRAYNWSTWMRSIILQVYCLKNGNTDVLLCSNTRKSDIHTHTAVMMQAWADIQSALCIGGELVFVCELEYDQPTEAKQTSKPVVKMTSSACMRRMFIEQKHCDATIEVGDRMLFVHRAVVAVYSSVLDRAFNAGLQETIDHNIKIDDFNYEPVRAMIEYFYAPDKLNDQLDNSNSESTAVSSSSSDDLSMMRTIHAFAEDVLKLADKYDVQSLKDFCDELLAVRVNELNVCAMLVFADTYKCAHLTRACLRRLRVSHRTVCMSAEWKSLERDHTTLFVQLTNVLLELFS